MAQVFVNQADSFLGAPLVKRLTTKPPVEEEDADEDAPEPVQYTVISSLSAADSKAPKGVSKVISTKDKDAFQTALLESNVIIFDISSDFEEIEAATSAIAYLHEQHEDFETPKTFICISTCMTWAATKPLDPDADEMTPLTEEEYRRRRPHRSFKAHIDCERLVTKCGKKTGGKLRTYVVNSGLLYGLGESALHGLFKQAWELKVPQLPIYGDGNNYIPMIHASDLISVVMDMLQAPPSTRYIVAVDDAKHTLTELTTCISQRLGTGQTAVVPVEDALLDGTATQAVFDQLTINQQFDAGAIGEMEIEWVAREGFVERFKKVAAEYRWERGLRPLRIAVHGPPAAGKTTLAQALCIQYKLPLLSEETVVEKALAALRASARALEQADEGDDTSQAEADKEELEAIEQQIKENGVVDREQVVAWYKKALKTRQCQNQGYVMDGLPTSEEHSKELFLRNADDEPDEEEEEDDQDQDPDAPDSRTVPEFVVALTASDDCVMDRVLQLPEATVVGTKNEGTQFQARLAKYRTENTDEATVLNYFNFHEIHPVEIAVEDLSPEQLVARVADVVGPPRNYGLTPEEQAAVAAEQEAKERAEREAREAEEARLAAIQQEHDQAAQAEWTAKRQAVMAEHQAALDQAALPLRTFLMQHIMPTLTEGLMQVCKTKPEDPIDYLAEYLFQNNPQID